MYMYLKVCTVYIRVVVLLERWDARGVYGKGGLLGGVQEWWIARGGIQESWVVKGDVLGNIVLNALACYLLW